MKYIKLFEEKGDIAYSVGDIVACIDDENTEGDLKNGKKYIVLELHDYHNKYHNEVKVKELDYFFVVVKDIETNNTIDGWLADRFIAELDFDVKGYDLI